MFEVELHPLLAVQPALVLRELSGADEQLSPGVGPVWSTALLERLLVDGAGHAQPGRAYALSLAQRDRAIAALHAHTFGEAVESHVRCGECSTSFELAFSLRGMVLSLVPSLPEGVTATTEAGVFALSDGARFRLPTTGDERDLAALGDRTDGPSMLAERCLIEGDPARLRARLPALIEALCPVLDLSLAADCPHCGARQAPRFDVVSFFGACLRKEAPLLNAEIHLLASNYHWSLSEILSLPRRQRRALVHLIQSERRSRRREVAP